MRYNSTGVGLAWLDLTLAQFCFCVFLFCGGNTTHNRSSELLSLGGLAIDAAGCPCGRCDASLRSCCPFQDLCHRVLSAQHLSLCLALHCGRLRRVRAYAIVQTERIAHEKMLCSTRAGPDSQFSRAHIAAALRICTWCTCIDY